MATMPFNLRVTFSFLLCVAACNGIRCYNCTAENESNCLDESSTCRGQNCVKRVIRYSDGSMFAEKFCAGVANLNCEEFSHGHYSVENCGCGEDLCNYAAHLEPTYVVPITILGCIAIAFQ